MPDTVAPTLLANCFCQFLGPYIPDIPGASFTRRMSLLHSPGLRKDRPSNGLFSYPSMLVSMHPDRRKTEDKLGKHLFVLPVLLLEFLALALTRAVMPGLLLEKFGNDVYLVMGCVDCVRGLLAFVACPVTGKISDTIGRRICLLVTVLGTCAPVCVMSFFSWESGDTPDMYQDATSTQHPEDDSNNFWSMLEPSESTSSKDQIHPYAIPIFVCLLALSGLFSSTFTLVFAYISDTVERQEDRVAAYGLALATFGLSFTVGPMAGGYLAQHNTQYVFVASLVLTVLDLLYIYMFLPESRQLEPATELSDDDTQSYFKIIASASQWNPVDTLRLVSSDAFMRKVAQVAFFYYTGLWALISTLSVYAVKRFHLSPERLGELMSALGLSTMIAEAVLVRLVVPIIGEKLAVKVGLVSFALQCLVLGFANQGWHLFVCAAFSLLGNLVYPSLSSLVSGSVAPDAVGEALGALNGVKALTEGIGPLVFGFLMTVSEESVLPGWPYLLASLLVLVAYRAANNLPSEEDEDFIYELETKSSAFATSQEAEGLLSDVEDS